MATEVDKGRRIIRSVKDLPPWFAIKKYWNASTLSVAEWYELLIQRHHHFNLMDHPGAEKFKNDLPSGKNPYYAALLHSREQPLSPLTDDLQILLIGGGRLQALKYDRKDFSTFAHAISPLTIRRLYQQEHRLKKTTRKRIRAWFDQFFDKFDSIELTEAFQAECNWALSYVDMPIFEAFEKEGESRWPPYQRTHDLVEIDLTVPDRILIDQFTKYLRNARKNNLDIAPARSYKAPDHKKWVEYRLLPYLDLKLWEVENNVSIPYRVFADAIFPPGQMGEEMIRKTTKKIADQVMSREYLNFLAAMAADEIAEKI